jgi:hypothetical protein
VPDAASFHAALAAAERADDPVLISAALDALGSMQVMSGHFVEPQERAARRLALMSRLPAHHPRAGSEIHDILHMAVENAITAGEVSLALEAALRFGDDRLVAAPPHMVESKPMVPLVLLGRFDETGPLGERAREMWENAGRPAARWLAPPMYSADLAAAVTAWERVGARYERACTLALIPSRRAEAAAELAELGVPMPA